MPESPATWTDARLAGTRFGPVEWFAQIDSTNRHVLDRAASGAPEGLVAVADVQTAGRGRLGRSWHAPPGASLLVSVLLRPRLPPEQLALVTIACALAAADAVRELAGVDARLKWPNDLVVDDRKLAGILAEALPAAAGAPTAVVVGMGLNVRWDEFPPELADSATACNLCGAGAVDRVALLAEWLVGLDERLDALDGVVAQAAARSATVGRRVRVELPREAYEAEAIGLDPDGRLVVRRDDGRVDVIGAGDVVHLRPA